MQIYLCCLRFRDAVFASLRSAGVDPALAYPTASSANGCSVVSARSGRVFYKAFLTLTPATWDYFKSPQGMTTSGFVARARLMCSSIINFADKDAKVQLAVTSDSLAALLDSRICKKDIFQLN